jgi:hypothetical protein
VFMDEIMQIDILLMYKRILMGMKFHFWVDFTKWMQILLLKKFYYKNGPHG